MKYAVQAFKTGNINTGEWDTLIRELGVSTLPNRARRVLRELASSLAEPGKPSITLSVEVVVSKPSPGGWKVLTPQPSKD